MKKTTILIIVVLFMVIGYAAYNVTINIYGNGKLAENLSDFKVYLSNLKVNGKEVSGINNTKDGFTINDINGDISVDVINDSTEYDTEAYLSCDVSQSWTFDYTGGEQTFTAPITGTYKLEVWGAQGYSVNSTYFGGYGAYSIGFVQLKNNTNLYIYVGQNGPGGYGNFLLLIQMEELVMVQVQFKEDPGGGSTHILLTESDLSALENNLDEILIVSGGGGASTYYTGWNGTGGHAGGYMGGTGTRLTIDAGKYTAGTGGSQTNGGSTGSCGGENGSFGKGGSTSTWGRKWRRRLLRRRRKLWSNRREADPAISAIHF